MRTRRSSIYRKRDRKPGRKKTARPSSSRHLEISTKPKVAVVETHVEQSVLPYDENLLERARTQWQFGDWKSLAQMNLDILQHHPDRAKLALLAAAGRLQTGKDEEAKLFIRLAQGWGASKKLISQILIAGVYDSLARVAALAGLQTRAIKHFESAVAIGSPGNDLQLITLARANNQIACYQLQGYPVTQALVPVHLRNRARILPLSRIITSNSSVNPPTIVVAGMRQSGSTALFNIIRIALEKVRIPFVSGYSEHQTFQIWSKTSDKLRLVKTHEFRDDIANTNNIVITTRRDLRDTVASAKRRRAYPMFERIGGAVEYAKYNRILHDVWIPISDYIFEYEKYMDNSVSVIEHLLAFLGLEYLSAEDIYQAVIKLPTDQYSITLLSPDHITDPERNTCYLDTLGSRTVEKINNDHANWLSQYGYVG